MDELIQKCFEVLLKVNPDVRCARTEKDLENVLQNVFQSLKSLIAFHKGYAVSYDEDIKIIRHLCIFGDWDEKTQKVWFEYMGKNGERSADRGKLMRNILKQKPPYQSLIIPDFKSKYKDDLGIDQAIVTPVFGGGSCVGAILVSYANPLDENSEWTQRVKDIQELIINYVAAPIVLARIQEERKLARMRETQMLTTHYYVSSRAHDMKGYFNNILYCIDLIEETKDSIINKEEEMREYITDIKELADKGMQEYRDIINVVKQKEEREQIEIGRLVDDILDSLPEVDWWISIEKDFREVVFVNGYRGQLHIAFQNLILNAIEAMDQGGTLTVKIEVTEEGSETVITISDTGHGMSKEQLDLARKFDVSYTTKPKGTGLGLPLSHYYIDRHRGKIKLDSEFGKGTEVKVTLPIARLEEKTK